LSIGVYIGMMLDNFKVQNLTQHQRNFRHIKCVYHIIRLYFNKIKWIYETTKLTRETGLFNGDRYYTAVVQRIVVTKRGHEVSQEVHVHYFQPTK